MSSPLVHGYRTPDNARVGYSWSCFVPSHKRQAALACFARVCRALSDPVLEVLWRYIDDVSYLLCGVQSCYRIEGFQWPVSFVVVPLLGPHRLIRYSECLRHIDGRTRSN